MDMAGQRRKVPATKHDRDEAEGVGGKTPAIGIALISHSILFILLLTLSATLWHVFS